MEVNEAIVNVEKLKRVRRRYLSLQKSLQKEGVRLQNGCDGDLSAVGNQLCSQLENASIDAANLIVNAYKGNGKMLVGLFRQIV